MLHEFLRSIRGVLLEFKIVSRGRRYHRSCRSKAANGTLSKFGLACRAGLTGDFHNKIGPKRQFAASQPYVRKSGVKPTCQDSSTDAFDPELSFVRRIEGALHCYSARRHGCIDRGLLIVRKKVGGPNNACAVVVVEHLDSAVVMR